MALLRTANVGTTDRIVRLVLALFAAYAGYALTAAPWTYLAYAVAVILALTALVRVCPAYALFGLSSCRSRAAG
ncbi:DUF2892 domain-containing protein [Aurantimonas sp. VKM B-3413]|uniref:YgaP family membrane protein n=1 Tax=Aurantimonas sp. VKM B-3413 TaxID=2779401 RepID=UPI001E5469E9|nr:DUF2892 domain-containing protein [Aurantimonas sp. VKM B-3413]MCB8839911.1 DUF2892 domain-containing protein [Aurantimonas sp. VKM B-3413]